MFHRPDGGFELLVMSTKSQIEHHQEQMEAARREFAEIWKQIEPLCDPDKCGAMPPYGQLCWFTFLYAKGLKK